MDIIIDLMKEIIEIGEKLGVRVYFLYFKVCGKKNWKYIDEVIELLNDVKNKGVKVIFD